MNWWDYEFKLLVIIFVMLSLILYFVWYILKLTTLANFYILQNNRLVQVSSSFPTYIYNLLISSARTKDGYLAIDKRPFLNNNWEKFYEDLSKKDINMIIIAGRPYTIELWKNEANFMITRINSMCSSFALPSCFGYDDRNPLLVNNIALDAEDLLTQFVHVFACKV